MPEIWIPLGLICFFLFLHIIRPYVKKLKVIDGLAWLPLLAFLSIIALIPAYGFRPETVPLLLYSMVLAVITFFKHINGDIKFRSFRKRKFAFVLLPLTLLVAAGGTAFYFTPQKNLSLSTQGVHTLEADDYQIRIYVNENDRMPPRRPLLVILPPEIDSLPVIDETAGALRDLGFTVLAFAGNGRINPMKTMRLVSAFVSGNSTSAANRKGRAFEEKRKDDLRFILAWMEQNPAIDGTVQLFNLASRDAVFFMGYDAGGSALVLSESYFPLTAGIKVRGLVAVESPLWSLYAEEVNLIPEIPVNASWFQSVKIGIYGWYLEIKPKKITGVAGIPALSRPALFLVSDRSREPMNRGTAQKLRSEKRPGRYKALHECFASAKGQAVLVSADGAGPLDYSDFPLRYPIVTTILRGRSTPVWNAAAWNSMAWNTVVWKTMAPYHTAAIVANFAESVFIADGEEPVPLVRVSLPAGIQREIKK